MSKKIFMFLADDLAEPLERVDNQYPVPVFKEGKGMYQFEVIVNETAFAGTAGMANCEFEQNFALHFKDVMWDIISPVLKGVQDNITRCGVLIPGNNGDYHCFYGPDMKCQAVFMATCLKLRYQMQFPVNYMVVPEGGFEQLCVNIDRSIKKYPISLTVILECSDAETIERVMVDKFHAEDVPLPIFTRFIEAVSSAAKKKTDNEETE